MSFLHPVPAMSNFNYIRQENRGLNTALVNNDPTYKMQNHVFISIDMNGNDGLKVIHRE